MRRALRGLDRALFRLNAARRTTIEDFVALYERLDLGGVLLGWDAQGKTLDNAEIAGSASRRRFVGFGPVDPNREDAIDGSSTWRRWG